MRFPNRSRFAPVLLLLLIGAAIGGLAWLLATRPVIGKMEKTWVCANCASQRTESVRRILDLSGAPTTHTQAGPVAELLAPESCAHSWMILHDHAEFIHLLPVPSGRESIHVHINLRGLTDQRDFERALGGISATNAEAARACWKGIVLGLAQGVTPRVQDLKDRLAAARPLDEITESLKSIGASTEGPSAP